jgi:hypothetical protein
MRALALGLVAFVALVVAFQTVRDPAEHDAWVAKVDQIRSDVAAGRK